MAKLGGTFDASSVEPNAPLEALPAGDYKVQILQSEMRVTKAGTGQMLWLDMEVLEGPLKGRHVYDQLNLINPNPTAEEIAQRTLSAICHAVGKLQVADSEELHFQPLLVRLAVKPNGYNEVRGHDTCPVRSIAAAEVEGLVLGQVRRLLASPQLVARTITAARHENGAAGDTELEEGDVIEALGALVPVWDELYPAEQARIMRLLIERIDVAPEGISVSLHAAGIRSLVAELADQEAPALAASELVLEAAE